VRGQEEGRKERVHIDAQASADDGGGAGRQSDGFAYAGEQGTDLFVETAAIGGEAERACGAIEEADADAGFETANGSTDGGLSDAEGCGGADEAASFYDGSEYADAVEKTIVDAAAKGEMGSQ